MRGISQQFRERTDTTALLTVSFSSADLFSVSLSAKLFLGGGTHSELKPDNNYFLFLRWCREPAYWQLGKGRKSFQDEVFLCAKSSSGVCVCVCGLLCKPFLLLSDVQKGP